MPCHAMPSHLYKPAKCKSSLEVDSILIASVFAEETERRRRPSSLEFVDLEAPPPELSSPLDSRCHVLLGSPTNFARMPPSRRSPFPLQVRSPFSTSISFSVSPLALPCASRRVPEFPLPNRFHLVLTPSPCRAAAAAFLPRLRSPSRRRFGCLPATPSHPMLSSSPQYEASWTATAGVTDNPSTLVANTSENGKNNKGIMIFVCAIADKMLPFLSTLTIFGLVYSHGPNPLLRISDTWIQVIAAGGVISILGSIILTGAASYFKETALPDHPGFALISTMVFIILQYSVLASCTILRGFERSSEQIIWPIGALVELSLVAFWFAFQRQPMIVGLKWTKDAFEWMLQWTKDAFECMLKWTKNAFEWMLKD